ncbi:MAG: hypothetical protein Q8900_04830 [Bacillota bacterium]|nr:hypothetical protein [Bacillota bacterium]
MFHKESFILSKLSIKTKIVIVIVLVIISIGVIIKDSIDSKDYNNNKNINIKNTSISSKSNSAKVNDDSKNITKNTSLVSSDGQNKQVTDSQNENEKELEQKYNVALNEYYGSEDKKSDVIKLTSEIINQDDKFYKAYSLRGIATCFIKISDENYKKGLADIDKSLQIKPNFGYGLFCRALALELYGHYDDAMSGYDKALTALKSENNTEFTAWSYFGQSSIYGRRGDVQNCTRLLKISIDLYPNAKNVAIDEENSDFKNVKDSQEFQKLIK